MATKTTCDRCDKAINSSDKKHISLGGKSYDLCAECFGRIDKWINSKEKKEEGFGMFG